MCGCTAFGLYLFVAANKTEGNDFYPAQPWIAASLLTLMAAPTLVSAALVFLKSHASHYAGVGILFALMVLHYAQAQIG